MMDAVADPSVTEFNVMKSARVGYTRILDHAIGCFVHQYPSPILAVQPRVKDAKDYSTTEIEPMLRDTMVLAEIVGAGRSARPGMADEATERAKQGGVPARHHRRERGKGRDPLASRHQAAARRRHRSDRRLHALPH
jgi:hypothetical protein